MKQRKVVAYTYLILGIILCLVFAGRFLPFDSYGAEDVRITIENQLNKYNNYYISEEDKGTLVQYEINTKVEFGKEVLPVNQKETIIKLSQIEGKYPDKVKVINQDANIEEINQYDAVAGTLWIQENSEKQSEDYLVVAYYDTYTEENTQRELESKVETKAILAGQEDRPIIAEETYNDTVTENIGELTSIHSKAQEVYNGYIKSNAINGTNYTTQYDQNEQIVVSKKEEQDTLEILLSDTFIRAENNGEEEVITELENHQNLVYKKTQIKRTELEKLLGKQGKLEILDTEGNNIVTIDENTPFNEEGIFTIEYENDPEAIGIRTSNIQEEGILNLKHTKEIKNTMTDVENIKIKTKIQLKGREHIQEVICPIQEARTTIDINMSNSNWSNKQQNEVTFDIYLKANTIKNNMFKNPTLQIEFPSQVEKVILGDSSILYANGLELQNPTIATNENGNLVMIVNLSGEQTQYDENSLELITDIKIATSIILKKEVESTEECIHVAYSNEYTIDGSREIGDKEISIGIENYQEEIVEEVSNSIFYQETPQPLTQNNDSVKLEVAPTKGETILKNDDIIYEGEYIKYNIRVTNTSEEDINNVKVVANIPEGVTYGELETNYYDYRQKYLYNFQEDLREKQINIGTIKAGEYVDTFYEVKVNQLPEGKESEMMDTYMNVYVGNDFAQSYSITNQIEPSEVQLFMNSLIDYGGWAYGVNVFSDREEEVQVKIHLPKAFTLRSITCVNHIVEDPSSYLATEEDHGDTVYESEEEALPGKEPIRELALEISKDNIITTSLKTNCYYEFQVIIRKSDLEQSINHSSVELSSYIEAMLDGKHYLSNENRVEIAYQNVKVSMTSPNEGEKVEYEQPIQYEVTIQNIGGSNVLATNWPESITVKLSDFLPEELKPLSITYDKWEIKTDETGKNYFEKEENVTKKISGRETDKNGNKLANVDESIVIPKGETIKIKIDTTAGFVAKETKIENSATVSGDQIEARTTNTITHTILPYDYDGEDPEEPEDPEQPDMPEDPEDPENPDISDEPGENEDPLENSYSIAGMAWLDENQDGERTSEESSINGMTVMLMDTTNANRIKSTTKTNQEGKYEFSNIKKGNYLVAFKYDTNNYQLTEYQKSGVNVSNNSDAINKTINLSGEQVEVGITDTIELNKSVTNIDIGLIESRLSDFKIDKYIDKVTVKTSKGTTEHNYSNKTLAKTEIRAKEIEGATVTIQYKIVITNVGKVAGTVNQIVDYLPDELTFSKTQNNTWNKNAKGELINSTISSRKIEAGEKIELTLFATKQMTANTTGTFTNKVSITGTTDANLENNTASADIIISVGTGAILYITIVIFAVVVLSIIVIYLYKKGKINIKTINKTTFVVIFIMATLYTSSNVWGLEEGKQYEGDYDFNWIDSHTFSGGPTGVGYCTNHNKKATGATQTYSYGRYASANDEMDIHKDEFGATYTQWLNIREEITGEFDLKRKGDKDIPSGILKEVTTETENNKTTVEYYVYGPFKYTCTDGNNVKFSSVAYNSNGEKISSSFSNADGTERDASSLSTGTTEQSFYIRIKKNMVDKGGVKKIELLAKR